MLVGPSPAGWGAMAEILPAAPGAGVGWAGNGQVPALCRSCPLLPSMLRGGTVRVHVA